MADSGPLALSFPSIHLHPHPPRSHTLPSSESVRSPLLSACFKVQSIHRSPDPTAEYSLRRQDSRSFQSNTRLLADIEPASLAEPKNTSHPVRPLSSVHLINVPSYRIVPYLYLQRAHPPDGYAKIAQKSPLSSRQTRSRHPPPPGDFDPETHDTTHQLEITLTPSIVASSRSLLDFGHRSFLSSTRSARFSTKVACGPPPSHLRRLLHSCTSPYHNTLPSDLVSRSRPVVLLLRRLQLAPANHYCSSTRIVWLSRRCVPCDLALPSAVRLLSPSPRHHPSPSRCVRP
jgi:hypothetical protein